jgi:hypothetical protein
MKKISLLLVVALFLALGAVQVFGSDVTIGGDVQFFATADQDDTDAAANMGKLRLRIDAAVDDYNTAKLEFRNDEAATLSATDQDVLDATDVVIGSVSVPTSLNWKFAYIQTDVSGALGIDVVGVTTRFGIFDEWHAHWNAATSWHRARDLNEDWGLGGGANGLAAVDFDLGMVTLKTLLEFVPAGDDFLNGFKFAVESTDTLLEGLNFIVGYAGYVDSSANTKGFMHGDAGYAMNISDISLTIPLSFVYSMEREAFGYGTGVKVGYKMFGVNVGLGTGEGGDVSEDFLEVLDAEVTANLIENATVYAKMYNRIAGGSAGDEDGFQSLDIGAKYALGAMTVYAGYVIATEDDFKTVVCEDDSYGRHGVEGSGFYLGTNLSF